jgi:hypothetical protein
VYPEDRVLVAYLPSPADFDLIRQQGWYRIPQKHAPKGLHAEYYAFYFGRNFGPQKWAIHYYAKQTGYELVTRQELLPDQAEHPRAKELYHKVSLGPLQQLEQPITSLRWRRIVFMHTTWDRFQEAREINDLFIEGGEYVDRLYATLKERGIQAERDYLLEEPGANYRVPLAIPCNDGPVVISDKGLPRSRDEVDSLVEKLLGMIERKGGQLRTDR